MGTTLHKMAPIWWLYLETEVKHLLRGMLLLVGVFSKLLLIRNTNKIGYAWYVQRKLWRVRVMFMPPQLSWQYDAISVEESALRGFNVAGNNTTYWGHHVKSDIFLRF
jgi:hypothetical protein